MAKAPSHVPNDPLPRLLQLAHDLGREDRRLAILGEGNVSARTVVQLSLIHI